MIHERTMIYFFNRGNARSITYPPTIPINMAASHSSRNGLRQSQWFIFTKKVKFFLLFF
jgi:hypothetical protein